VYSALALNSLSYVKTPEYLEKTTDLQQITEKTLLHNAAGFKLTTLMVIGTECTYR
jgi:hypothetical protein